MYTDRGAIIVTRWLSSIATNCVLLLLFLPAAWGQNHLIDTANINPTIGVPRWKMYINPENPYELWLVVADDHDQFFKSTDAGVSWTAFEDTAANVFESSVGGEVAGWLNYHASMTGYGSNMWVTHPDATRVYWYRIGTPGGTTSDIGLPQEVITDVGLRKRSNVVATADELFIITRTTNDPAGNVRFFRYSHDGMLIGSGWVEDLPDANVRVGSSLDNEGRPVVVVWVDGAKIQYYRWDGSGFVKPTDSLVWSSSDETVGCGASALTREFAFTVTASNTLHVVWSCTAESVKHAYKVMGSEEAWRYIDVVDHPEQDGFHFRSALAYRGDDVWMFVALDVNNDGNQSNIWHRKWDPLTESWGPLVQLTFDNAQNRQPNTIRQVPPGAPAIPFMYWKGHNAVYTDRLPLGGSGSVPVGGLGEGLSVSKAANGDLNLSWAPSCLAEDSDFGIYEGSIGDFASHLPSVCSTMGLTAYTVTPGAGSVYFLAVPQASGKEGSYGFSSDGSPRSASVAPCLEQEVISCP